MIGGTGYFCGLTELAGLSRYSDPRNAMRAAAKELMHQQGVKWRRIPFIMFTGTVAKPVNLHHSVDRDDNYGEAFATFIEENKLGKVIRSSQRPNWTKNMVQVWIWEPDYDVLFPFLIHLED